MFHPVWLIRVHFLLLTLRLLSPNRFFRANVFYVEKNLIALLYQKHCLYHIGIWVQTVNNLTYFLIAVLSLSYFRLQASRMVSMR